MLVFPYDPMTIDWVGLLEVEFDSFGTGLWIKASYFVLDSGALTASIAVIQRELRGWSEIERKELRRRLRLGLDLVPCEVSVLWIQLD